MMDPKPLDGAAVDHPLDRRMPLADWLTGKDNPLFARSVVNRYVGYLLGRGLVEPVDDMRTHQPADQPGRCWTLCRSTSSTAASTSSS